MSRDGKIYITGLGPRVEVSHLQDHFGTIGVIKQDKVKERFTHIRPAYAALSLPTRRHAHKATPTPPFSFCLHLTHSPSSAPPAC